MHPVYLRQDDKDQKRGCVCVSVCVSESVFVCGGPAACFMWSVINCCDISPLQIC